MIDESQIDLSESFSPQEFSIYCGDCGIGGASVRVNVDAESYSQQVDLSIICNYCGHIEKVTDLKIW